MEFALVASALMLGLAGTPHCVAMCGAACGAALRHANPAERLAFHVARVAGYAAAGAVVASGFGLLAALGHASPGLRPLWTLWHAAALALGLWLLWHGRQPAWVQQLGRRRAQPAAAGAGGWQRLRGPARSAAVGSLWVAWPCGLLQSALVVAALANGAVGGAATMAAFALASGSALFIGPWLWQRAGTALSARSVAWATRGAGALLAGVSGWALGHGLWLDWLAYCAT